MHSYDIRQLLTVGDNTRQWVDQAATTKGEISRMYCILIVQDWPIWRRFRGVFGCAADQCHHQIYEASMLISEYPRYV